MVSVRCWWRLWRLSLFNRRVPWGPLKLFLYPGNYEFDCHTFLRCTHCYILFSLPREDDWCSSEFRGVLDLPAILWEYPCQMHEKSPTSEIIQPQMWERLCHLIELTIASVLLKIFPSGGRLRSTVNTVEFLLAPAPSSLLTEMFNWSLLSRTFPGPAFL